MTNPHTTHTTAEQSAVLALRLVLSLLTQDLDVPRFIIGNEINNCPECWRYIAVFLAGLAGEYLWALYGSADLGAPDDLFEIQIQCAGDLDRMPASLAETVAEIQDQIGACLGGNLWKSGDDR